ncbi:MAG TPA: hypothetical protein VIN93_04770 [Bryobacteraceae bacterium]|jgi:hypothetical protein
MSDFWKGILVGALIGFPLGILASIIAAYLWDLMARFRANRAARKLVGTWGAYNIHDRIIDATPMPGAGLTVVSLNRPWCAADSGVLDVHAQDIDPATGQTREHDGSIVLDPVKPWLATRILRYADSDEVSQQRLEIDLTDWNTVHVFPDATVATLGDVYGKHAWRRVLGNPTTTR